MVLFGKKRPVVLDTRRAAPKKTLGNRIKSAFNMVLPRKKRAAAEPITSSFRVLRTRPYGSSPGTTAVISGPKVVVTPVRPTPAPKAATSANSWATNKSNASELEKLKVLEESTKNMPRYLFRACSPMSGGGFKGLNTIDGIYPHAYVDADGNKLPEGEGGAKSIHDIPYQVTRRMAIGHLSGQRPARTDPTFSQFSSWAATFALVLQYGHSRATSGGLICVLDRYNLPKNTKVYHCPSMMKAGLCDSPYDHEYLVHGPVEGPGFKAVTVQKLLDLGLYTEIPCVLPQSARYWWGPIQPREWESLFPTKDITEKQVKKLKKIAGQFGDEFTLPVLAAFLTLDRRKLGKDGKFSQKEVKIFADAVDDLYVPEEYGGENSIIQPDGIYITGYPMVSQLAELFKALVEYNYGRGVRLRRRIQVEDLSLTSDLGALGLPQKKASMDGGVSTRFAFGVKDVVMETAVLETAVC
ncbi:hypothetical protein H072_2516 [Dactylellina haptotyla CBS 200.50]|uniref:Uncharacterized protein n=1 Tax=Dactylellina haptotyla (strain CBS 200.50) TaxID=1284197 RepID=S8AR10_DACHA|nr:hypothetical protein H072_2516 [Dactylellina haptotyla CBS 200.50]